MAMSQRKKRGQIRVIEIILTVSIAVVVILLVMNFTRPLRGMHFRERGDLFKFAHNVLTVLADTGVYERVLFCALNGTEWESWLKFIVASNMPPGVLFTMRIYKVTEVNGTLRLVRLDTGRVTNYNPAKARPVDAELVKMTYVCVRDHSDWLRGRILYIELEVGFSD